MSRGLSYGDWRLMTRWQRAYHLTRSLEEAKARMRAAQKGLSGIVGAVVAKVLGI